MSAIILNILDENREKMFTQTQIIDEIEIKVGKRKSPSTVSQQIKFLYNKNKINYTKGIGKTPAQISFKSDSKTKTKPIKTKPIKTKPIKTKPIKTKPIKTKPIPISTQLINDTDYPVTKPFDITKHEKYKELEGRLQRVSKDRTLFKDSLKNKEKELEELKNQLSRADFSDLKLGKFSDFEKYMMDGAKKTGKNSYRKGEITFRKSGLKPMFLTIRDMRIEGKI